METIYCKIRWLKAQYENRDAQIEHERIARVAL